MKNQWEKGDTRKIHLPIWYNISLIIWYMEGGIFELDLELIKVGLIGYIYWSSKVWKWSLKDQFISLTY